MSYELFVFNLIRIIAGAEVAIQPLQSIVPTRTAVEGVRFLPPFVYTVCLFVFPHDFKNRCTKLDIAMFHDESRKPIYFGVKRSEVKVTSDRNIAGVGLCTLVSAGFFQSVSIVVSLEL